MEREQKTLSFPKGISTKVWSRVAVSITDNDNHYTIVTSMQSICSSREWLKFHPNGSHYYSTTCRCFFYHSVLCTLYIFHIYIFFIYVYSSMYFVCVCVCTFVYTLLHTHIFSFVVFLSFFFLPLLVECVWKSIWLDRWTYFKIVCKCICLHLRVFVWSSILLAYMYACIFSYHIVDMPTVVNVISTSLMECIVVLGFF